MKNRFTKIFLFLLSLFLGKEAAWAAETSLENWAEILGGYETVCLNEKEPLWHETVCGPLFIVDPKTRVVLANRPDPEGVLVPAGDFWTGAFPEDRNISNTSIIWLGETWAMVMDTSLGGDLTAQLRLLFHESYHRFQRSLDFYEALYSAAANNSHMGQKDGRLWLRMELRALAAGLAETDDAKMTRHLKNALYFRAKRYQLYEGAQENERLLDLNEGLSEYTGLVYSGIADDPERMARATLAGEKPDSYERAFSYTSLPPYGVLMDRLGKDWKANISFDQSPADYALSYFGPGEELLTGGAAIKRAVLYGYHEVLAEETQRFDEQLAILVDWNKRFVEGPVLKLPIGNIRTSFDPNKVANFEGHGQVFEVLTARSDWGALSSEQGLMISWETGTIIAPLNLSGEGFSLEGQSWTLDLLEGWEIKRDGDDWKVEKKE